jgi:hypothetical protein
MRVRADKKKKKEQDPEFDDPDVLELGDPREGRCKYPLDMRVENPSNSW